MPMAHLFGLPVVKAQTLWLLVAIHPLDGLVWAPLCSPLIVRVLHMVWMPLVNMFGSPPAQAQLIHWLSVKTLCPQQDGLDLAKPCLPLVTELPVAKMPLEMLCGWLRVQALPIPWHSAEIPLLPGLGLVWAKPCFPLFALVLHMAQIVLAILFGWLLDRMMLVPMHLLTVETRLMQPNGLDWVQMHSVLDKVSRLAQTGLVRLFG